MTKKILFEVWQNGKCKMGTDSVACVDYSLAELKSMKEAGCTFRWQDKRIALNALIETLRAARAEYANENKKSQFQTKIRK